MIDPPLVLLLLLLLLLLLFSLFVLLSRDDGWLLKLFTRFNGLSMKGTKSENIN